MPDNELFNELRRTLRLGKSSRNLTNFITAKYERTEQLC